MLLMLAERGLIPTPLLRMGIRRRLARRAKWCGEARTTRGDESEAGAGNIGQTGSIAEHTDAANRQHYEVPAAFFELMLGPHLKYSSGLFDGPLDDLKQAEERMLALTCERAELSDDQRILELGCGWGSLSLFMAAKYPKAQIVALSNSHSQKSYIDNLAAERGLHNLRVVTADLSRVGGEDAMGEIGACENGQRFDRVISVEMFEHMRNWRALVEQIFGAWLAPQGKLFVHYFCHREVGYAYESGANDWLANHFFSGGIMPSEDFLGRVAPVKVELQETVSGANYARTLEAWLARLDANQDECMRILGAADPSVPATVAFQRWRLFLLACAELFAFRQGTEWYVTHQRAVRGSAQGSESERD